MISSEVLGSQSYQLVEIDFTGAAAAANGAILAVRAVQGSAASRVFAAVGGTSDSTVAVLSSAAAVKLLQIDPQLALDADQAVAKTGLINFLGEVENIADGAECVVFAIGGLNASSIYKAELSWCSLSATGVNALQRSVQFGPSYDLTGTLALNGSSKLLKADGSTAIDLDTDKLITVCGVAAGCFKISDTGTAGSVFEASQPLTLRLWIKR